ncbi:MAG: hypothetical protein HY437_01445 [Candidatus Magasanikbacteria bacterium]|nr:hypothetical protein [Candidatus Magasanikbacteria bacterium]
MDNAVGSLTQQQVELIVGTILGDGYLRIVPGRRDAFLEINHSYSAFAYVEWKYEILSSITVSAPKQRQGNGNRVAYRFYTRQHPELTSLFRLFYHDGAKRIPVNLVIRPMSLAIWYMDDGSRCRDRDIYLNTQQYSRGDQLRLVNMLARAFGIRSSLNRDKEYWRIRLRTADVLKFQRIIAPYIIPSMQYKLSNDPVETSF